VGPNRKKKKKSDSENDSEKKELKVSSNKGNRKVSPYDLNSNDNPGNIITQV